MTDKEDIEKDEVKPESEEITGIMANKINNASECLIVFVYGKRQIGKNSYIFKTMRQLYGSYSDLMDVCFWKPEDFCNFIDNCLDEGKKVPAVLFDDFNANTSGLYKDNRKLYNRLDAIVDTIGLITNCLFLTAPEPEKGINFMLKACDWKIKVIKQNSNGGRIARGYENVKFPSGQTRNPFRWEDYYNVKLPDSFYKNEYEPIRRKYLREANRKFIEGSNGSN